MAAKVIVRTFLTDTNAACLLTTDHKSGHELKEGDNVFHFIAPCSENLSFHLLHGAHHLDVFDGVQNGLGRRDTRLRRHDDCHLSIRDVPSYQFRHLRDT